MYYFRENVFDTLHNSINIQLKYTKEWTFGSYEKGNVLDTRAVNQPHNILTIYP